VPGRRLRLARAGTVATIVASLLLTLPVLVVAAAVSPGPSPAVTERPVPLDKPSRPVRIWVPYAGIDLPVISSERNVPGNPRGYPLCDVAQYWTRFDMPGQPGTTWILGHAQPGMFLPLYEITYGGNYKELVGKKVKLQLRDRRLLTYRITEVRPASATNDLSIAERPNKRQQRLVLQTSTGVGSAPKLEVAARLIDAEWTDEPRPQPQPRACWQPPTDTPRNSGQTPRATATPPPEVIDEPEATLDAMTLVLGSGAVLLGATFLAVYLVRRP
jgi:hypothetical protein